MQYPADLQLDQNILQRFRRRYLALQRRVIRFDKLERRCQSLLCHHRLGALFSHQKLINGKIQFCGIFGKRVAAAL